MRFEDAVNYFSCLRSYSWKQAEVGVGKEGGREAVGEANGKRKVAKSSRNRNSSGNRRSRRRFAVSTTFSSTFKVYLLVHSLSTLAVCIYERVCVRVCLSYISYI